MATQVKARAFDAQPPTTLTRTTKARVVSIEASYISKAACLAVWTVPALEQAGYWTPVPNWQARSQKVSPGGQLVHAENNEVWRCSLQVDFAKFADVTDMLILFIVPHDRNTIYPVPYTLELSVEEAIQLQRLRQPGMPKQVLDLRPGPHEDIVRSDLAVRTDPDTEHYIAIEAAFAEQDSRQDLKGAAVASP